MSFGYIKKNGVKSWCIYKYISAPFSFVIILNCCTHCSSFFSTLISLLSIFINVPDPPLSRYLLVHAILYLLICTHSNGVVLLVLFPFNFTLLNGRALSFRFLENLQIRLKLFASERSLSPVAASEIQALEMRPWKRLSILLIDTLLTQLRSSNT